MRPQLMMFVFGVFAVGTILSLIVSGSWFDAKEVGFINSLANLETQTVSTMPVPTGIPSVIAAIERLIKWDYPYLNNPWGFIFKLFILYPVSFGVTFAIFQFLAEIISGILTTIRSILPL